MEMVMDQERWKEIDAVLEQALELEPGDRAGYLLQVGAGDEELRQRVGALLDQEVAIERFLEFSAFDCLAELMGEDGDMLAPGAQLGRYRIEFLLGAGGMGEVYLALDTKLGRKVALKLLPLQFITDQARVKRFEREARAASALNHGNIVTVYDFGEDNGHYYIAEEYVAGQTLRQKMAGGPVRPQEALEIAAQIVSGLAAAHETGVVHRDIKPENVMIRPDGQVKVLDFGLAMFMDSETPLHGATAQFTGDQGTTRTGAVMGTVRYMSPEQARGEQVDHHTDIFSLGVVLYEMLAGRTPFTGANHAEVLRAILEQEPESLEPSVVPRELRRIITRALAKKPAQRYTAAQMLGDLQGLRRRLRWIEWRGAAMKVAAMTLVLFSIGMGAWLGRTDLKPPPPVRPASVTTALADGKIYEEAAISPDGRLVAYAVFIGGNRGLWVRDFVTGSERTLVPPALGYDCQSPTFTPDSGSLYFLARRQSEDNTTLYQIPVSGGAPRRVLDRVDSPVAFAPNGHQFVFMREDRGSEITRAVQRRRQTSLFIANLDGSNARPLVTRQEPDRIFSSRAAWSPDGRRVAFAAGSSDSEAQYQLYQIALDNGVESQLSSRKWGSVEDLAWMRGNSGLVLNAADANSSLEQIWFFPLDGGEPYKLANDSANYTSLSATADSRTLFAVQYQDQFSLWIMPINDSRHIRQMLTGEVAGHNGIAWTLGGQILYAGGKQAYQQLWITDVDGRNNRPFASDAEDDDAPSLSPDDRYLVYCSRREAGGNANIWRMEMSTRQLKQLSRGRLDVDPECSPDGQWVVYVSWDERDKASVWKTPLTGGTAVQLAGEITENPSPAISPDGRRLAYYRNEGRRKWIDVISLDDHRLLRSIEVRESFYLLEWTRDGRALVYAESAGRVANLYRLPLTGGPPRPLTDFSSHTIVWFATSRDGTQMALSRSLPKRDLVRITNFR
jgi:Tol biopolymer transport system component